MQTTLRLRRNIQGKEISQQRITRNVRWENQCEAGYAM